MELDTVFCKKSKDFKISNVEEFLNQSSNSSKPNEEENAFSATFNQAAVGMARVGLDGSWLLVNQKICDIIGYSREELMQLTFQDITFHEDLNSDLSLLNQLVAGEISHYALEKRYIRKDGSLTWANLTVSLVRNQQNEPSYFISVIEDINQRKTVENELHKIKLDLEERVAKRTQAIAVVNESLEALINKSKKSESRFNKFFNLSADIIVITDVNRHVIQINSAFERILGYKTEDIIGAQLSQLIHPDDLAVSVKKRELLSDNTVVSNFENRMIAKDGSIVWLSWSFVLLSEEQAIFSMARDMTEAKKQEKIISDQKLKMANVSKMNSLNRMAAGIAHEINNPMMVIYGQVYLLKKFIKKSSKPSTYLIDGLDKIDSVAQRVKKIVNGLRSFSKDASQDPFEFQSLQKIINDTMIFCNANLVSDKIRLDIQPAIADVTVYCQPVQISQVLLNLVENSYDAVSENVIKEKWISIECEISKYSDYVYLKVIDNGHGLDKVTKENLFHPFFTTKPVGKGTGLGLSISKAIMELNKGELLLDEDAKLTTFVMKIPLTKS